MGRLEKKAKQRDIDCFGHESCVEMRYYLDTNILIFMRQRLFDELSRDVEYLLDDYGNLFYTSSVCVHEFIHLCQIGKVKDSKKGYIDGSSVISWLTETGIEIRPVTERHLEAMASLPLRKDHHDPFDRLIIAQAIADGIDIVTSDRQFENYRRYGLKLTFNQR